MNLAGLWDQLVDAVCRPPRDDSYSEADLVGGRRAAFRLYDRRYYRQDVTLENKRGQKLQGSHYRPCVITSADGRLPCVIYCHCNSGSRRDAEEMLFHLLPKGITVFAFDFAGSGLSEGTYVTLGAMEVDDLAAVVHYLRDEGSTSTIGLWGRSMGAVTALLYSQQDPSIAGMVLDSPFSRLVDLMMELGTEQQLRIPKPLLKMALAMLKRSVRKRAAFSVDAVAPLDCVGGSFIPALFGHAKDDSFVNKHHSERLVQAYAGDKNFISFEGDHNSVRPDFFYDSALIFLIQALRVEELVGPALDLQALPEEALPHLRAPQNSIYVTSSRSLSKALEDEEVADAAGSDGATPGGSSPGSPTSPSSRAARLFSPPWSVQNMRRRSGRRSSEHLAATLPSQQQQQEQGEREGQQGTPQGAGKAGEQVDVNGLAAGMATFALSEEEALQLALEASLLDAQQQQQGQGLQTQQGDATCGNKQAAAGYSHAMWPLEQGLQHIQQPAAEGDVHSLSFASSGRDGGECDPPHSGSSAAEAPHSVDEEQAMLAAAIAASLAPQQQPVASAAEATHGAAAPFANPEGSATGQGGGSEATELSYYYGSTKPKNGAEAVGHQQQEEEGREQVVSAERATGPAAQTAAEAHATSEAAVVRAPSLQLKHALSDAAEALAETGGSKPGGK